TAAAVRPVPPGQWGTATTQSCAASPWPEQALQRCIDGFIQERGVVADTGGLQPRIERAAGLGEAGEIAGTYRRAVAQQFLSGFGITETVAVAEREVALLDGEQLQVHDIAAGAGQTLGQCDRGLRSEEHTSELQSRENLVCRLLL